ncbi:hypothetical protein HanRHA438_Chr07g0297151 [Helianthus annuus]|nr:hypothetical protein HanIR_Chr07g0308951 [Helianthus annuus]KAJ0907288.1 hypothetical protein HanRHA438_Chr07g0297151 [Helianthus annuus]
MVFTGFSSEVAGMVSFLESLISPSPFVTSKGPTTSSLSVGVKNSVLVRLSFVRLDSFILFSSIGTTLAVFALLSAFRVGSLLPSSSFTTSVVATSSLLDVGTTLLTLLASAWPKPLTFSSPLTTSSAFPAFSADVGAAFSAGSESLTFTSFKPSAGFSTFSLSVLSTLFTGFLSVSSTRKLLVSASFCINDEPVVVSLTVLVAVAVVVCLVPSEFVDLVMVVAVSTACLDFPQPIFLFLVGNKFEKRMEGETKGEV